AVQELIQMEGRLLRAADKEHLNLAPFIGIGCPGKIEPDGSIDRGAQNLPGNWPSSRFNLPATLLEAIPTIGEFETTIVMHNDAVVQGLSEAPAMKDVERCGIFAIGTGLGNAIFANRKVNVIRKRCVLEIAPARKKDPGPWTPDWGLNRFVGEINADHSSAEKNEARGGTSTSRGQGFWRQQQPAT